MKISYHDRDTPSFKQSDIYFALTINSGDTASRAFWTNSLLVTPLLNHVNAKIMLNPLLRLTKPLALYTLMLSKHQTNKCFVFTRVQTDFSGCVWPQYKSVCGFQ